MILSLLLILALALILVFEVWMFVDVIRNPKLDQTARILWILGMVLVHPIVAIVYYFTAYSGRDPRQSA